MTRRKPQRLQRPIRLVLVACTVVWSHLYTVDGLSFLAQEIMQSLHGPGFGVVALIILKIVASDREPRSAYVMAGTLSLAIALLSELIQIPFGRSAQLSDVFIDAIGIVGFLGLAAIFDNNIRKVIALPAIRLLKLITPPALTITLLPTIWLCCAFVWRQHSLPQIVAFETIWERAYTKDDSGPVEIVPAMADWPAGSRNIAHLSSKGRYGLMLRIFPHPDWSGYSAISFVASSMMDEGLPISIGIWGMDRMDGTKQAHHYERVTIHIGPRRYCIILPDSPRDRATRLPDKSRIFQVLIGSVDRRSGAEILVDDFRLEGPDSDCRNYEADRQKP